MHAVARNGPLVGLVLLLLAPFGWTVTAGVSEPSAAISAVVGAPAPDLSLPSLRAGTEQVRLADHRGKVVFLDFWSSWCAPCRRAMPNLDRLRQAFPRHEFEVVGVNVDSQAADARRFLDRVPVSYPVVADAGGSVAERFGIRALPALVVIDQAGVVRDAIVGDGAVAHAQLRDKLIGLLKEGEVQ